MLYTVVNDMYRRERELRLAAVPLLVVERNQAFIERLKKTYQPLPSWPATTKITLDEVGKYRAYAKDPLLVELLQRRDDIDALFQDVVHELRRS